MTMKEKSGKITPNGVILEEHEYATVLFLTEQGYDVELIKPSPIEGTKSPDIKMDGVVWEMKSPIGKGKWVIKNIMQKASHQSENVIIDLRRSRQYPQEKYINEAKQRFESITRLKRLKIIGKRCFFFEMEK